jgi:hypothetical protein
MDRIAESLATILKREIADYDGSAYRAKTYFSENSEDHLYVVFIVPDVDYPRHYR